jgi:glycosyltransferase involved in cell wall biosynthesis
VVRALVDGGHDVTLDIIGPAVGLPGEDERRAILADSIRLGVDERVRCLGPMALDALMPIYRTYDVFLLPTLPGEGIPRVLLEAMAAGVPVVTTRVAGIPSLIAHETNGLLVDASNDRSLTDAVSRVIADGGLRRHLIASGYATARQHTLDRQAEFIVSRVRRYLDRPGMAASHIA